MALNWRDIQDRTLTFVYKYGEAKDEDRDAKPFWKDLFALFNIDLRTAGAFEERVKMHGRPGVAKMDYFSPGKFLIEHKSRGKDLDDAYVQAMDYFDALKDDEKPRYIIISDFEHFHIYDLEAKGKKRKTEIFLKDLPKHIKKFAFLADEEATEYGTENAINVKAVRAIGKLHKALKDSNYPAEDLSPLLTRLVFCFFADDTGIFDKNLLRQYLTENTKDDGSDIGAHLGGIFDVLNTKEDARQTTMHGALLALPYVNGGLFAQPIKPVFGARDIRDTLLECFAFDWSEVSPAIFGSMFQSVMNEKERHDLGAHYTSEKNIMKVIGPLLLDNLKDELGKAKSESALRALWDKVAHITLLDPACGCGNFLVISYRELRRIETEIINRLDKGKKGHIDQVKEAGQEHLGLEMDIAELSKMSVERMYGIELESFPAEVAKLSLWLMDHMMNMELGALYGKPLRKLPLTEAPHIVKGNALRMNWEEVVPKEKLMYILGNPPFIAKHDQSKGQKSDMLEVFGKIKGVGELDYVNAWYKKAAAYIQETGIGVAFVSTNSIAQGEQPGILWSELYKLGIKITFAHRTFKWSNEAQGNAVVHCVIVGFSLRSAPAPLLCDGEKCVHVNNINPYLVNATDLVVLSRRAPVSAVPKMLYGSKPADGGFLILSDEEKQTVNDEIALKYIKPLLSAKEYLNGQKRWCLWLVEVDPSDISKSPFLCERIEGVKNFRSQSTKEMTRELAKIPYLFAEIRQPKSNFVLVPLTSSENREYVPMTFFSKENIVSNTCSALPDAKSFHFGIMQSNMHMTWMRAVCGRLEMRYRYSNELVYNNFPWPEDVSEEKKKCVEESAQAILDARRQFSTATLADLYNPNTMPKILLDAHKTLDRSVDACYGKKPSDFPTEPKRLEFLFEKYQELIAKENAKPVKKN